MDARDSRSESALAALLSGLSNYERTRPANHEWSLANMERLLSWPELPALAGKAVQVGGSKGKGTTALYLEALAQSVGLRVGTYLSPHLHHVTERVRVAAKPVSSRTLYDALAPMLAWAEADAMRPSFFEALTAAALLVFARAGVDLAVFEVGLGGRLDATTAIPVDAAIVTGIELEHTEVLGDSLAAIAAEKAGILRTERPAFVVADGEALAVIEETARQVGARLQLHGRDFGVVADMLRLPDGTERPCRPAGDASMFETQALTLAAACLTQLFPDAKLSLDPAPRPELPGRFEVLPAADGWPFVLDGAHTAVSMGLLAVELRRRFPTEPVTALVASARGKAWRDGLRRLLPVVDSFLVTSVVGTPSEDPGRLVAWLKEQPVSARLVETAEAGVQQLRGQPAVRLVTGSFYLVAAARTAIRNAAAPSS
ncbi:MAG: bifunctional folylpolyglutamate synthase/dihydrofolate synthase [Planctomycetota bacterium]|jgi:dihydrofolate synthase/folylpolyglutamate synthase